jgi:hypothetical protein
MLMLVTPVSMLDRICSPERQFDFITGVMVIQVAIRFVVFGSNDRGRIVTSTDHRIDQHNLLSYLIRCC